MWAGFGGAAVGSVAGLVGGLISNHHSAKEARAADKRAYQYWQQMQVSGPKLMRQGYEDAGYNPMLALNGNSASMPSTHQGTSSNFGDVAGGAAAMGEFAQKLANKEADARAKNIKADTAVKDAQAAELRARERNTNASTDLINTQDTATQVGIGTNVANTLGNAANVGLSAYSAKRMSDVAKQNAATNARNATVNERKANTTQVEVRRNAKGQKVGEIQRSIRANGVPSIASPSAAGNSAKNAAKILPWLLPFLGQYGLPAAGVLGMGALYNNDNFREKYNKSVERAYKHNKYWSPYR